MASIAIQERLAEARVRLRKALAIIDGAEAAIAANARAWDTAKQLGAAMREAQRAAETLDLLTGAIRFGAEEAARQKRSRR